jgi:hypothetical protein
MGREDGATEENHERLRKGNIKIKINFKILLLSILQFDSHHNPKTYLLLGTERFKLAL